MCIDNCLMGKLHYHCNPSHWAAFAVAISTFSIRSFFHLLYLYTDKWPTSCSLKIKHCGRKHKKVSNRKSKFWHLSMRDATQHLQYKLRTFKKWTLQLVCECQGTWSPFSIFQHAPGFGCRFYDPRKQL